jgi:hypothetical protein
MYLGVNSSLPAEALISTMDWYIDLCPLCRVKLRNGHPSRCNYYNLNSNVTSCYTLPAEGKKRWCGGCAKEHAGAVDVVKKKKK